jgi:hypothetical protein
MVIPLLAQIPIQPLKNWPEYPFRCIVGRPMMLEDLKPNLDIWIEYRRRCREIAEYMGKNQGNACVHNVWIPDGSKDETVNRLLHRQLLENSLDKIFEKEINSSLMVDAVESKLFGSGSESFVVGSFEFYMGYAITRKKCSASIWGTFIQPNRWQIKFRQYCFTSIACCSILAAAYVGIATMC